MVWGESEAKGINGIVAGTSRLSGNTGIAEALAVAQLQVCLTHTQLANRAGTPGAGMPPTWRG
eukprot:11172706-Lingulodinium_polyedra.AAC.1